MSGMTFPNEASLFNFSDSEEESGQDQLLSNADEMTRELENPKASGLYTNKSDPLAATKGEDQVLDNQ